MALSLLETIFFDSLLETILARLPDKASYLKTREKASTPSSSTRASRTVLKLLLTHVAEQDKIVCCNF